MDSLTQVMPSLGWTQEVQGGRQGAATQTGSSSCGIFAVGIFLPNPEFICSHGQMFPQEQRRPEGPSAGGVSGEMGEEWGSRQHLSDTLGVLPAILRGAHRKGVALRRGSLRRHCV